MTGTGPSTARPPERTLAVLGSPIGHSKSPGLHTAAYRTLGLPWRYSAVDVSDGKLGAFLTGCDSRWRGVSLTMPLKREVLPMLDTQSDTVRTVGAANTVLFDDGALRGFNTDVAGIVAAFSDHALSHLDEVHILGAGATAASVLAAVAELGASRVHVSARDPERARSLEPLAATLGITVTIAALENADRQLGVPDAVVSTLPGSAELPFTFSEAVRRGAALLDVSYEPWPSSLARSWASLGGQMIGGQVIGGLEMLLHQAIGQVRIFVTGTEGGPLPREAEVIAAMRESVGL